MMKKNKLPLLIALGIIIVVGIFYLKSKGYGEYLTLEYLKGQHGELVEKYKGSPVVFMGGYMLVYILVTALSIPGAAILTLAGGAVFGLVVGTILVSFASTIGATLAFLISRTLLKDYCQNKFKHRLAGVNKGIEKEGAFYLR